MLKRSRKKEKYDLIQMLESLTEFQRKNFKVVLIRENNDSKEWCAFVCKTDVFIDTGIHCNVNNMQFSDVLNTISKYGIKTEIEYKYFNYFSEHNLLEEKSLDEYEKQRRKDIQ